VREEEADRRVAGTATWSLVKNAKRSAWTSASRRTAITTRWPGRRQVVRPALQCAVVVRECWQVAVESCGLRPATRFHDIGHFHASTLISAGLHPKAIQTRLGHATIAETMDTHGHLFPDAEDNGRGALDSLLSPAVHPACPERAAEQPLPSSGGGRRTSRPVRRVLSTGALRPPDGRSSI
jgi:hypothetical protein